MTAQSNPYVKVYYSIVDDPKFRDMKLETKGAWLDLLITADSMYPAAAPLPRWLPRRIQSDLEARGLIDLTGDAHYRIHGLNAEREKRANAARLGGVARANALRQHSGSTTDSATDAERGGASPLRSTPSNSTPLRADRARDGLPHLAEHAEVEAVGFEIVGIGFESVADKAPATELDRLVEFHGAPAVIAAMRSTSNGKRQSWPQVIYGARNRLEPISPGPSSKDRREDDESSAARERSDAAYRATQERLKADPLYAKLRAES